jgi:hypothetical protein
MSDSALLKQSGRITFLLSFLVVAVACAVALRFLLAYPESRRVTYAVAAGLIFLGVFWIRSVEGRLLDAGLPRWYFWPYFLIVFASCAAAHLLKILDSQQTLMLFVALQIPTVLLESNSASERREEMRRYPAYNKPVGRLLFLLRLLLLAALWGALFHLQAETGWGLALLEMRLGLVLVAFVWVYNVEGRLMDAGLPRWCSVPYCLIVPALCLVPIYLKVIEDTHPLALALFVLLQIPTVFFKTKPVAEPLPQESSPQEAVPSSALQPSNPARQLDPVGGFEFATRVLILAGLLWVLHLLRGDTGFDHIARALGAALDAGSVAVCVLWGLSVKGRLKNLGRTRSYLDFCALVAVACLPSMAFAGVSYLQALVLFVVLQIPVVLMRRESILARLFLVDADS